MLAPYMKVDWNQWLQTNEKVSEGIRVPARWRQCFSQHLSVPRLSGHLQMFKGPFRLATLGVSLEFFENSSKQRRDNALKVTPLSAPLRFE